MHFMFNHVVVVYINLYIQFLILMFKTQMSLVHAKLLHMY